MPAWLLRFDGLYEPRFTRLGTATYGFIIDHGRRRVTQGHGVVVGPGQGGDANVAEFGALLHGLSWLAQNALQQVRACGLHVQGDSRLVIETVAGRWKLTSAKLIPLRDRARALVEELGGMDRMTFTKIPRAANAEPDALTRLAYHEAKEAATATNLAPAHPSPPCKKKEARPGRKRLPPIRQRGKDGQAPVGKKSHEGTGRSRPAKERPAVARRRPHP